MLLEWLGTVKLNPCFPILHCKQACLVRSPCPPVSWLTDSVPQLKLRLMPEAAYVKQITYKRCWSKDYSMIHEIDPKMSHWSTGYTSFFFSKGLRNFYLITDVQVRTCDYCFHVKWEVSWTSSLLNYRANCVEMEGKGQLNWQFAKLDMFEKMKMSAFGNRVIS